jgi:hypothetical protein
MSLGRPPHCFTFLIVYVHYALLNIDLYMKCACLHLPLKLWSWSQNDCAAYSKLKVHSASLSTFDLFVIATVIYLDLCIVHALY